MIKIILSCLLVASTTFAYDGVVSPVSSGKVEVYASADTSNDEYFVSITGEAAKKLYSTIEHIKPVIDREPQGNALWTQIASENLTCNKLQYKNRKASYSCSMTLSRGKAMSPGVG